MSCCEYWKTAWRTATAVVAVCGALSTNLPAEEKKPADKKVNYVDHVQPILRQKCFTCHNPDKKSSGLDLTTYTNLMQGGASGEVIEAGSSGDSYLYMLVSHESEPFMPPGSDKIPDEMLAVIRDWIDGGALETAGSKPVMSNKPKLDLAIDPSSSGRPEGPPPMPIRLGLEPVVHSARPTAVTALATSPWAPLAAVGGQNQVLLYNTDTLELLGVLPFPEGIPESIKFSRNGKLLLVGGGHAAANGRVIVYSVETGERVIEVGDELDSVLAADISADQSRIALGGPNRVVRIYSTADGSLLHEIRKHTDWIYSIAFSPDGVLLATADRNGGMFVWETYTAREYLTLRGHGGAITELSWRADSNILASCSEDGSIRLWEMENGNQVKNWGAHGGGVTSVEFARDGTIVSCGRDRVVKLWDQNGKETRAFPAFGDIALKVTYCDETNRVIAGDWTGAVRVWNAADAAHLGDLNPNPPKLEQRLATANQTVTQSQAEQEKLKAAYDAAQSELNKLTADLQAVQKTQADSQTQVDTAQAAVNGAKEQINKLTGERDSAAQVIKTVEPIVPLLKDASEKLQQAAAKSPEDKELAQVAAGATAQHDGKAAGLATAQKTVTDHNAEIEKTKQALATAEKQLTDGTAALEAAKKKVAELTPAVQAANEKATAAKQALDAATQSLATAQASVTRWQDEIEFQQKLVVLAEHQKKLDEMELAAAEAQAAVDQIKADAAAAKQVVTDTNKQAEAAATAVTGAEKGVADATAAEAAAAKSVATLEGLLPALQETVAKGDEALKKAPEDKEVAAAATQLKSLLDTKTAALEAARKDQTAKANAIKAAQDALAAAQKQVTEIAAALEAAQKIVAEVEATLPPAEEKFAAAQQAAEAAGQQVEQMKAEIRGPAQTDTAQTASAN